MHLLLIHQAFVSPIEAGGTRHFEFARHLVQNGHLVTIIASDLAYFTGIRITKNSSLVQSQSIEGVRIIRTYTYPSLHRSFVGRLASFLSFMVTSIIASLRVPSVDIVMGTSPPIFQLISAWLISRIRHRPFLLEIRDLWPEFAIDMGILKNRLLVGLSRRLENFLYNRAHHFLVNSPAYRDYLVQKGIPETKLSFIANGVDTSLFDPAANGSHVRKEFQLDGKFVVTYAGAFGPANDLSTLLKAADILRKDEGIHFLLVGGGKDRHRLEEEAKQLGLFNVTFAGVRPKSQIADLLAASDACVALLKNIPMFKTTYPNKVFDYMAAAKPIILAIDGVIRDVVEEAQGGLFVNPGDPQSLSQAVLTLRTDRDLARTMGIKARAYVELNFDRKNHVEAFENLLEQVRHRHPPTPRIS